jgi:hypothetical protein
VPGADRAPVRTRRGRVTVRPIARGARVHQRGACICLGGVA